MNENKLKYLINSYLKQEISVDLFIKQYMGAWRTIRDEKIKFSSEFQGVLDRIFTCCDCYDPEPDHRIEIDETTLHSEIQFLCDEIA